MIDGNLNPFASNTRIRVEIFVGLAYDRLLRIPDYVHVLPFQCASLGNWKRNFLRRMFPSSNREEFQVLDGLSELGALTRLHFFLHTNFRLVKMLLVTVFIWFADQRVHERRCLPLYRPVEFHLRRMVG